MKHLPNNTYQEQPQGFTLIEVLVAMVILTIGILSLYTLQMASIKGNSASNVLTTASTWATDHMEYLLALDHDHADLIIDDDIDTPRSPITHDKYDISWTVSDIALLPGSKSISVTVSYRNLGTTHNYTISCIKGGST